MLIVLTRCWTRPVDQRVCAGAVTKRAAKWPVPLHSVTCLVVPGWAKGHRSAGIASSIANGDELVMCPFVCLLPEANYVNVPITGCCQCQYTHCSGPESAKCNQGTTNNRSMHLATTHTNKPALITRTRTLLSVHLRESIRQSQCSNTPQSSNTNSN